MDNSKKMLLGAILGIFVGAVFIGATSSGVRVKNPILVKKSNKSILDWIFTNVTKLFLKSVIFTRRSRYRSKYINNLDDILNIKTVVSYKYDGLFLDTNYNPCKLYINSNYDWYLISVNKSATRFEMFGVSKNYPYKCLAYILSKNRNLQLNLEKVKKN